MTSKYDPRRLFSLLRGQEEEFDLQAGSRGMTPGEAVARYLKSPGHFLAVLRFFRDQSLADVSAATRISVDDLQAYEKGQKPPSLKDLSTLAKHYDANLRILLEVFGHVGEGAAEESLGIAAKFGGELAEDEKVSLRELMERFKRSRRGG